MDKDIKGKKRKKEKCKTESNSYCLETNEPDEEFLPPKKKKKKKKHDKQYEIESNSRCVGKTDEVLPLKKKKNLQIDENTASDISRKVELNIDVVEIKSKKKKKRHLETENCEDKILSSEKLDRITSDDNEGVHMGCKKKKKKTFDSQNQDLDIVCNKSDDYKMKHKKKKDKKDTCDESYSENLNSHMVKKKKKKKHKEEKSEMNEAESGNNFFYVDNVQKERKTKKATFKEEHSVEDKNSEEGEAIKKGHSKKNEDKHNTEPKESGHKNNVKVNEKKIDSEDNDGPNTPIQSGQWGAAFNENKDKQNKFLRLLGGFKKGAEDQTAKAQTFSSKFANYAMDQSTEKTYQSKLEQQYEKAMATNLQRGIGLGFQQPPDAGKKFCIDKGATKSVKFD